MRNRVLGTACAVLMPFAAAAQELPFDRVIDGPPPPAPPATVARAADGRITMRAVRLEEPMVLDGRLDESIYERVPAASGFIQQEPMAGEHATEQTEVWVLFDRERLHVALRCWDSRPDQMVANEMRRDNRNIWLNDNVIIVLDTFYDRRSAFFFQTNPLGGVRDALVVDENTTNYDWNTVWDVKSQRFDQGWTAEMAIPFKSLRYPRAASQVWGFNVLRVVRSKNELSLLSPVPRSYGGQGLFKLSSAATLVGIEPPAGSRNIELKPYLISDLTTDRSVTPAVSNALDANLGFDAKYGVTSSLILDFTYNTDFAQVEIDEQQVNLTRFSLVFPEKRDFFLEGQGVFDFAGAGGPRGGETPILFFSRRIGLNEGQPVPIDYGTRLTGRVGRLAVGALHIRTGPGPRAGAAATNFSVVRLKRDVLRRSNIGLIATHRTPSLDGAGSNQVAGVDANLAFHDNLQINGFYAQSATTGRRGDAESYRGQFRYAADRYGFEAERLKVGQAFNPEVGFMRRRDFRRDFVLARFSPRPAALRGIRKVGWEGSFERFTNSRDIVETRLVRGTVRVELENSDVFNLDYVDNYEFLERPFQITPAVAIPSGAHRFDEIRARYELGPQRRVSGSVDLSRGAFFTGDRMEFGYGGRVELSPRLAIEPRLAINWVDLPQGSFTTKLVSARNTYTITPRMFVSALVQYNSSFETLETNARFRWEYEPGSDLYVVYTEGRETGTRGLPRMLNRGIAVKATRLVRF